MEILKRSSNDDQSLASRIGSKGVSRRGFLRYSGLAGASAVVLGSGLASCSGDDAGSDNTVNLGSGDTGVLNYAYALEQLEAAFYTQVVANASFATIFTATEQEYLRDIRDHEIAHREFLKAALTAAGNSAIRDLEVNFSMIKFDNKADILEKAQTFEDLGVAAYNGAGKLITSGDYLTIAGKIVSVEARHAALIRDLRTNGSFADLTTLTAFGADVPSARDGALNPPQVLALAAPYIKTPISGNQLPTS